MDARVLVIGEALIDIVEAGGRVRELVGGSPANVAVGVARQGHEVHLLTRIGRDDRGARIAEHVAASGAAITADSWTEAATATAHAGLWWRTPNRCTPSRSRSVVRSWAACRSRGGAASHAARRATATGRPPR